MKTLTLSLSIGLAVVTALFAQHSYTPADIQEGGRLFVTNCSGCHGATGTALPGAQLPTGKFKRAATEDDAIRLVRAGIPDAGMPAFNHLTELQTGAVLAYLRTLATPSNTAAPDAPITLGDPARGQAIFEGKGECLKCHQVNGVGGRWAPDLSTIGGARGGGGGGRGAGGGAAGAARGAAPAAAPTAALPPPVLPALPAGPTPQQLQQLQRSLLDPNADVADANRTYRAVTRGGVTITGKLLNLDTFTAQLLDTNNKLVSLDKENLREPGIALVPSPMPSYRDKLTPQEFSDLLSYLVSLR